jgi:hypothetical protein
LSGAAQVTDLLSARTRFISDVGGLLQSRARVRDLITVSLEAAHATHIGERGSRGVVMKGLFA